MRKISSTMISQHPDNSSKPYWHNSTFISTRHETKECFLSFSDLGVSEYNWDWEGKYVDESVIERLFSEYHDYFRKNPLGKEKFLKSNMVKDGCFVIDVGINKNKERKIVGDVDRESFSEKAGLLTPVPGGVGPMTVASLMQNTVLAAKRSLHEEA